MLWWSASGGILTPICEKGVLIYSTADYIMVHALAGIFYQLTSELRTGGKRACIERERAGRAGGREWGVAG